MLTSWSAFLPASYTPSTTYQHDQTISSSGTITINRPNVGTYDVHLPFQDQGWDGGHVQVTAYGSGKGASGSSQMTTMERADSGTP